MSKKAFLVGINKYKDAPLNGCVNDVDRMKNILVNLYGFQAENIRMKQDKEGTRAEIIAGLKWLAEGGANYSLRVFHYAGHGHYVPDENMDEPDGADEALVPYDYKQTGFLIDDDLKALYDRFPQNSNFTIIMDCCHSGTNQRDVEKDITYRFLPMTYDERKKIAEARKKFNQAKQEYVMQNISADMQGRGAVGDYRNLVLNLVKSFEKQHFGSDYKVREGNVLMAACQSDQKAADANFDGTYHGAFTYYLSKAIDEANGQLTYQELIEKIGGSLDYNKFKQIPQIECGEGREHKTLFAAF